MSAEMDAAALIAEQVDRLFADTVDRAMLRAAEEGRFPRALWDDAGTLGLATALVPEAQGGAGLDWPDLAGVFEVLGYHAAPLPLGEVVVATWALGAAGLPAPEGIIVPAAGALTLEGGSVHGDAHDVPWGGIADHVVAVVASSLCLLPATAARREPVGSLGRDPRAHLRFDGIAPIAIAKATSDLVAPMALLRSAQIGGALARCLELCVEYGNTRVQFGRPIGKFQAIQHAIAQLANETAAVRTAARLGLRAFGAGEAMTPVAVAKIRSGIAAGKGAAIAHAVHAAIGITEEHSLHNFTRRLWQWRDDFGTEHAWAERLGFAMLAQGGDALWPAIVGLSA